MQRLSRRNMLVRIGAFAGGVAGAGLAGPRLAGATPAAFRPESEVTRGSGRAPSRFVLEGRGLHGVAQHGGPRRDRPGEVVALRAMLVDEHGAEAGTFHATSAVLAARLNGAALEHLEQHTFELSDGLIVASGLVRRAGELAEFAVTGGTRAYRAARGGYLAVLNPRHLGGDGTASFAFELVDKE